MSSASLVDKMAGKSAESVTHPALAQLHFLQLISSEKGEVWWNDLKELPKLDLSLDMEDMLRIFLEEDLSEFFYYQDGEDWKYDLK